LKHCKLFFFPIFFFTQHFLSAQYFYSGYSYSHYEIVQGNYGGKSFVIDTLTKDSTELIIGKGSTPPNAFYFSHGLIVAKFGDLKGLMSLDGKVMVELAEYMRFFPKDSLVSAIDFHTSRWMLFDFQGTLLASLDPLVRLEYDDWNTLANPEGTIFGVPFSNRSFAFGKTFALMDKTGTWLTAPVFDSIGTFANGKAPAKYHGHRGTVTEKGIFTYSDTVAEINLGGMSKPFRGMGPPYKYMNKGNQIVIRPAPPVIPPQPTTNSPIANQQPIANPPIASQPQPKKVAKTIQKKKPVQKFDVCDSYGGKIIVSEYSHYKKSYHGMFHKTFFLIDTIGHDTIKMFPQNCLGNFRFVNGFIEHFPGNDKGGYSLTIPGKHSPFIKNAKKLDFFPEDSLALAWYPEKGWQLFNNKGELIQSHGKSKDRGTIVSITTTQENGICIVRESDALIPSYFVYRLLNKKENYMTDPVFKEISSFETDGTARAVLINGQKGKINSKGQFLPDGSSKWERITIEKMLSDTSFANVNISKYKTGYSIFLNEYCYDERISGKKGKWNYTEYYLNGKLVAKEKSVDHRFHLFGFAYRFLRFVNKPKIHETNSVKDRRRRNCYNFFNDRVHEGKQKIVYQKGNHKKRMVDRHCVKGPVVFD
jgi:hypothetical protein